MAREQLGICAEANLHASYLPLNALDGQEKLLRYKLPLISQLLDRLSEHFSEAMLTGIVAIGSNFWSSLYPNARPAMLDAFPDLAVDEFNLSPVPIDLLIVVRADRLDVITIACQQILQLFQGLVEVQEQLQGFRYLDGRNFTGFIDTPYNPANRIKRQVGLVDVAQQPIFSGGSYVYFQHLSFDQAAWHRLSQAEQEEIMGYDKVSGKALANIQQLPCSHLATIQNLNAAATVLIQSMPFYQLQRQGVIQLNFAATSEALKLRLHQRLGLSENAKGPDLLLNYHRVELSAAFFAPSISFLEQSAKD